MLRMLRVLRTSGDLEDAGLVVTAALGSARAQEEPGPGDPGGGFDDRSVRLETTLDGAGSLAGSLTPEAAAGVTSWAEAAALLRWSTMGAWHRRKA